MDNLIEVDFRNKCREIKYIEEDATMWDYEGFYREQKGLGLDKGYDPNNPYSKSIEL